MSGSAKAGTTAERQKVRAVDANECARARSSEARVRRTVFLLDKDWVENRVPHAGFARGSTR
jgi:hypothetical protein